MGNTLKVGDIVIMTPYPRDKFLIMEIVVIQKYRFYRLMGISEEYESEKYLSSGKDLLKVGSVFDKEKKDGRM